MTHRTFLTFVQMQSHITALRMTNYKPQIHRELDCDQSLFCWKIRGENERKHRVARATGVFFEQKRDYSQSNLDYDSGYEGILSTSDLFWSLSVQRNETQISSPTFISCDLF